MTSIKLHDEDAERDRLAEEYAQIQGDYVSFEDKMEMSAFKAGWYLAKKYTSPVRSVKDASAEELMENPLVRELIDDLKAIGKSPKELSPRQLEILTNSIIAAFKGEL